MKRNARLPCNVGDKVFVVYYSPDAWVGEDFEIVEAVVEEIRIAKSGIKIIPECHMIGDFNQVCVCVTKERAQEKLEYFKANGFLYS